MKLPTRRQLAALQTRQQVYDYLKERMLRQGIQATCPANGSSSAPRMPAYCQDKNPHALVRDPIGWLILPEYYDPAFEGTSLLYGGSDPRGIAMRRSIHEAIRKSVRLHPSQALDSSFLLEFVIIHDYNPQSSWEGDLLSTADEWGLKP